MSLSARRALTPIVALLVALLANMIVAPAAHAQDGDAGEPARREDVPGRDELDELVDLSADPDLSEGLERLTLIGNGYEAAAANLRAALDQIDRDRFQLLRIRTRRYELQGALRRDRLAIDELDAQYAMATLALDDVRAALRSVAVETFVAAGSTADLSVAALAGSDVYADGQVQQLTEELTPDLAQVESSIDARILRIGEERRELTDRVRESTRVHRKTLVDIASVEASIEGVQSTLAGLADGVRGARWLATVDELDLPLVVLDAYVRGAREESAAFPGCNVQWWMLAGIGWIESGHGTFGGSTVGSDGRTSLEIIGIPLNGQSETAVISDTDGGVLDSDPIFDRAVGPMQFIPSTWSAVGLDGNADDDVDPHNLYDAARSAAHYLCLTGGGSLLDANTLGRAYFAYNNHDEYVLAVFGKAVQFREFVLP